MAVHDLSDRDICPGLRLLGTVMLSTWRGKTRIMKANMLESMLHGLDEGTSTQLRNCNVKDKMEKHVFVKLRDGPEGLCKGPD